jgi:hypothetical protein
MLISIIILHYFLTIIDQNSKNINLVFFRVFLTKTNKIVKNI